MKRSPYRNSHVGDRFPASATRPVISWVMVAIGILGPLLVSRTVMAIDDHHWNLADAAVNRGMAYLRTTQREDGSWSPEPGPAVTAIVVAAMLDRPNISVSDPTVAKAVAYILTKCQSDGGIHDGFLENYNTSICLSALARVNDQPGLKLIIQKAQAYLRKLQWHDQADPHDKVINSSHPYFGGAGYGRHGRPDMSNTQIMLEGLYESGMDCNDPIFVRALAFITRCQGTKANREFGDQIVADGGFIYATSVNKDHIGTPQSMASPELVEQAKAGKPVSGLRTYGSMTYAGFKSYLYANLNRDDPRVVDAYDWIRHHYTLDHNPGLPPGKEMQGYYYYLVTFSRAMAAWGSDQAVNAL